MKSTKIFSIDEMQFLSGEEAIRAVIEDFGGTRKTVYDHVPSMNNDFYIRNLKPDTGDYPVSSAARIRIQENPGSPVLSTTTAARFPEQYRDPQMLLDQLPFTFTVSNGEVVEIEEQYTP